MKKLIFALMAMVLVSCGDDSTSYLLPYEEEIKDQKVSDVGSISKESFRPSLDILFVIDDSGSMSSHQMNLSTNITKFTDSIVKAKFLDYHIGVITSTASGFGAGAAACCGKLAGFPKFIDRNTPNGMVMLANNVMVGTNGDASEKFYDPVTMALSQPNLSGYNDGFYRPDSYLVILFITDTDDQSVQTTEQFMSFLLQLKGSQDRFFIGAAYIPKSEYKSCSGESPSTTKLDTFFSITQAQFFSLCDPDYGSQLANIGQVIALKAQTMLLKSVPKQGTIKVSIGSEVLPEDVKKGWSYNPIKNAIEFGEEINWEVFPDNTFPQVDYEAIVFKDPKPKPTKKK